MDGSSCHYQGECSQLQSPMNKYSNFLAACCMPKCHKRYCMGCILSKHDSVPSGQYRISYERITELTHGSATSAKSVVSAKAVKTSRTKSKRIKIPVVYRRRRLRKSRRGRKARPRNQIVRKNRRSRLVINQTLEGISAINPFQLSR